MRKFSELNVILSNCLNGGTGWNQIATDLVQHLYEEMQNVEGLDFKKINSNTVRGGHNGFTIILSGVFYQLKQSLNFDSASNLLEYVRNAANKIPELTYSEIRIEQARHFSTF
jgi:hypothetical protein